MRPTHLVVACWLFLDFDLVLSPLRGDRSPSLVPTSTSLRHHESGRFTTLRNS
jgi:hypothetical protein